MKEDSILSQVNSPADLKKIPMENLHQLANEIRQRIIDVTFKNGGHLGSNLGVVELTIALHYVFNLDIDRVIWDVSHQCYTHKILTGRRDRFDTIRTPQGLSGFTDPKESPYDTFIVGHAGTSISTALGIATGDSITGINRKVIAVCGDGALTAGMSFEALNYAGLTKKNMIVVLNDNKMSISHTVGALANYLTKLRSSYIYRDLKDDVSKILEKMPKVEAKLERALKHMKAAAMAPLGGAVFEEFGWNYYGPLDGQNIKVLINSLKTVSQIKGPIMLHVVTEKGFGLQKALEDPYRMHGIGPLKVSDGKVSARIPYETPSPSEKKQPMYTDAFADYLVEIAGQNDKVVGITAAMPDGTGLAKLQEKIPSRYFDVGICEQQAVGMACGMVKSGLKPVVAIYSTFLQRAFDQLFHEIALQGSALGGNVVFALDRAGLVGADGATHNGLFDIAYCRIFPGFVVMAPRDSSELKAMLQFGVKHNKTVFIRFPRAPIPTELSGIPVTAIQEGKAEILRQGNSVPETDPQRRGRPASGGDGVLLAYGSMVYPAYAAAEELHQKNIELTVVNARFAKPVDEELILKLLKESPFIVTLEEHSIVGGFGSAVLEAASLNAEAKQHLHKIIPVGVPDRFIEHGNREKLLKSLGLDKEGIIKLVLDKLGR